MKPIDKQAALGINYDRPVDPFESSSEIDPDGSVNLLKKIVEGGNEKLQKFNQSVKEPNWGFELGRMLRLINLSVTDNGPQLLDIRSRQNTFEAKGPDDQWTVLEEMFKSRNLGIANEFETMANAFVTVRQLERDWKLPRAKHQQVRKKFLRSRRKFDQAVEALANGRR